MPARARMTPATCAQVRPRVSVCGSAKSGDAVALGDDADRRVGVDLAVDQRAVEVEERRAHRPVLMRVR